MSYCTWRAGPCLPCGVVGILCTFSNIRAAAAADIARSSQQSSPLQGQAVQYDNAGSTARPSQYKSWSLHPSPPAAQGRTPCWTISLGPPPASVVRCSPESHRYLVHGVSLHLILAGCPFIPCFLSSIFMHLCQQVMLSNLPANCQPACNYIAADCQFF
jgi:hypothetical protein